MAAMIAIGTALAVAWLAWIVYTNRRDEAAIAAWEKRTGSRWLREGYVKKGGRNGPPTIERPPPPQSLRLKP